jgi:hypothetical protein
MHGPQPRDAGCEKYAVAAGGVEKPFLQAGCLQQPKESKSVKIVGLSGGLTTPSLTTALVDFVVSQAITPLPLPRIYWISRKSLQN